MIPMAQILKAGRWGGLGIEAPPHEGKSDCEKRDQTQNQDEVDRKRDESRPQTRKLKFER